VESLNAVVADISLGGGFGAAVDVNGLVWSWGSNAAGELGIGDYEPRSSPFPIVALQGKTVTSISCGGSYCMALGRDVFAQPKHNLNDTVLASL
jgi:alpha-tubulin suppressor-like RCC1 family protein